MVNKNLLAAVLAGNILMVLAGAAEGWHILNLDRVLIHSENLSVIFLPFFVGQLVGCILFAVLADLIGRRLSLLIMTAPFLFGFIISEFFYAHMVMLGIGRAVTGLAVGGANVVLPIYIGEISDSKTRGSLVSTMFTSFMLGVFLVNVAFSDVGYYATIFSFICVLLAIIFAIVFGIKGPETPVYYLRKGRDAAAMISLEKLRSYNSNNETELKDMQEKVHLNTAIIDRNERVMTCLNFPGWVKGSIMVFIITISDTLTVCVNLVAYFQFASFDYSVYSIFMVVSDILELISSCLCPILIDRIGRKFLLILSFGGSAIFLTISTILLNIQENHHDSNLTLILMTIPALICRLCAAIGIAPIRFVLISELFSLKLKMTASAAFNILHFVSMLLSNIIMFYGFFNYIVIFICFVMTAIVKLFFLETNNKSLQQIQVLLNAK